ncbi:MAG: hypothetical protein Q9227_008641 [Pyrenula ochraceoflavens]
MIPFRVHERPPFSFYRPVLEAAGCLASEPDFNCTLNNDIHPIFAPAIFQSQSSDFENQDMLPLDASTYKRMQPALQLASRLLTDKRYLRFWASMVKVSRKANPGAHLRQLRILKNVTPHLASRTVEKLSQLAGSIRSINFTINSVNLRCTELANPFSKRDIRAWVSAFRFQCLLSSSEWQAASSTTRTCSLLDLANSLLNEIAPLFMGFLLSEADLHTDLSHFRPSWESFFLGGVISPMVRLPEPSSQYFQDGAALVPAERLMSVRLDNNAVSKTTKSVNDVAVSPSESPVLSLPTSYVEMVFSEAWFQAPYPEWDLDLLPKARYPLIWYSKNERMRNVLEFSRDRQVDILRTYFPAEAGNLKSSGLHNDHGPLRRS